MTRYEEYSMLGYDTLPLLPEKKLPYCKGWQKADPADMWKNAPRNLNIGVRAGGAARVAIIDCDEYKQHGTFANVRAILAGLGWHPDDYPVVSTARGGKHVYLTLAGATLAGNYCVLPSAIGAGEFRYGSGSYVVAPSSVVGGKTYCLTGGDFRQLAHLDTRDVNEFMGAAIMKPPAQIERIPAAIVETSAQTETSRHIPRSAWTLLAGQRVESYASRSEAEQALILILVNVGHPFESVLNLFMRNPCAGKFAEMRKESGERAAITWLRRSYDRAYNKSQSDSPDRQTAKEAILWAKAKDWPGRTGMYDLAVFLAHADIAYQAGRVTNWAASVRDLAERAGCSPRGANNATKRLLDSGFLTRVQEATASLAPRYSFGCALATDVADAADADADADAAITATTGQSRTLPKVLRTVRKCQGLSTTTGQKYPLPHTPTTVRECILLSTSHDSFRWAGLGKTCSQVWDALEAGAFTDQELAQITGRHVKTIRRALKRMSSPDNLTDLRTGEVLALVERQGEKWERLPVDLDHVANVMCVAGIGEKQKARHKREREAHKHALELGRKLKPEVT